MWFITVSVDYTIRAVCVEETNEGLISVLNEWLAKHPNAKFEISQKRDMRFADAPPYDWHTQLSFEE